MKPSITRRVPQALFALLAPLAALVLSSPASAAYPERPITLIVPFGPGGVADLTARRDAALGRSLLVNERIIHLNTRVARRRPPERFQELLDAALRVFAAKGVRRARMADIAAEMGVAPGSLYNYVESKEALFHWIVARGASDLPVAEPPALPIPTPRPEDAAALLQERLAEAFVFPRFEARLRELHEVRGELYDRIAGARRTMSVIERSAIDLPELFDTYFATLRRSFFERLRGYIAARQRSGDFRASLDADVAARFVVEAITFFARHRFGDPSPPPLPDDAEVRAQVIALASASLLSKLARPAEKRR